MSGAPKNGDSQSAEDTDQITQCLGACMTLGKKTAFPEGFNEGTAVRGKSILISGVTTMTWQH